MRGDGRLGARGDLACEEGDGDLEVSEAGFPFVAIFDVDKRPRRTGRLRKEFMESFYSSLDAGMECSSDAPTELLLRR